MILVSHSRGGITATAAANARPDLIDRIVYVASWRPVDLDAGDYYAEPETATVDASSLARAMAGNPAELGLLRVNFRTADPDALAAFKAALLADGTDDENLDVGSSADRAQAATWGRIPKTYVRPTDDMSLPLALQDRLKWLTDPASGALLLGGLAGPHSATPRFPAQRGRGHSRGEGKVTAVPPADPLRLWPSIRA